MLIDRALTMSDGSTFHVHRFATLKEKVSSGIVTYWMLKNLVLVTPSGGKCIPDGKD